MLVRIVCDWDWPNLMRQTSGGKGRWEDFEFTMDPVGSCDFLLVLNRLRTPLVVDCPEGNAWLIEQEPPNEFFAYHLRAFPYFDVVLTQQPSAHKHPNARLIQTALPWHINKNYDELKNLKASDLDKPKGISWITSNLRMTEFQRRRMNFLDHLTKTGFDFDLFGRGFKPIADKFEAMGPYKYSFAVENCRIPHCWTEKIIDSYLSWTMPIYFGCPNITDYFPKESMIQIDINEPKIAAEVLKEALSNDLRGKSLNAISEARDLVLKRHHFFPFMAGHIRRHINETKGGSVGARVRRTFPANRAPHEMPQIQKQLYRYWDRLQYGR